MQNSTFSGGLRFAFVILAVLLAISACSGLGGEPEIVGVLPTQPSQQLITIDEPAAQADINFATGAQVFAENCTSCHGINGQGDGELVKAGQVGPIRDFTDLPTRLDVSPQDFFHTITNGRLEKLMPPWSGSLSASERWSVAMYVYSLAYDEGQAAQGETLFEAAGANDQLITVDYSKVTDGQLLNGEFLPEFASELDAAQREAVVAYLRTLPIIDSGDVAAAGNTETENTDAASTDTESVDTSTDDTSTSDTAAEASVPEVLGTVTGQIINGTEGGSVPTGALIELHVVDGNFQGDIIPGVVNEDGSFTFSDVPMRTDRGYLVSMEYEDWFFASDFRPPADGATTLELPVTIYEASSDTSGIVVESVISQVFAQGGTMQVLQIMTLQNTSDKLYVGAEQTSSSPDDPRTTVGIAVPEGGQFVDMTGEGRFVVSPDERIVYDTRPVMPGEPHTLHMLFNLPYRKSATFEQVAMYPVQGELGVEVSTDGLTFTSDQLEPLGDSTMTGTNLYAGEVNLNAGDLISFTLSGEAPAATTTTQTTGTATSTSIPPTTIMIAVGLLFITISIGLFWYDRQKSAAPVTEAAAEGVNTSDEINALVRQVAELDVKFNAGQIKEAKYNSQRKALKAKIAALAQQKK